MQIVDRPIGEIKPYPKNAKEHTKAQVKKIAASIKEFGWGQPIVVNKDGVVIVGHGRLLAAKSLGMETVPTLTVELDEERARAYRLADNKLNESAWDMDIVIEELKALSAGMLDLTGFDENLILETKEDKPDISTVTVPRSKIGDLYELGEHKLLCGDSTDENVYRRLLGDEKARMIFTDPPYGVDYIPREGGTYDNEERTILNDDKTPEDTLAMFIKALKNLHSISTDDATLYWWYASRLQSINEKAWEASGWRLSQICIWLKESMIYSPGQLYHRIYEPVMVGWKQGQVKYRNINFHGALDSWGKKVSRLSRCLESKA
jgi:site-specific DNA-methyltransferase (adenine-specific)